MLNDNFFFPKAFQGPSETQQAIDDVNTKIRDAFHKEFGENYNQLRDAAQRRNEVWRSNVLGQNG